MVLILICRYSIVQRFRLQTTGVVHYDKHLMTDQPLRFYIQTFGCQMNVHDSEKMHALLTMEGAQAVTEPESANVIILNTCSVREKAEQKVFSRIGRIAILKRDNPELKLVLAGCMARAWG